MGLVHDDKFRAGTDKIKPVPVGFDEIKRDNGAGILFEQRCSSPKPPLQAVDCGGQDKLCFDMELLGHLFLPLLCELWGAEYSHAPHFATILQFPRNKQGFHSLAYSHVIGNEQADSILLHGHEQGNQLIGTRLYGNMSKGAKRTSA